MKNKSKSEGKTTLVLTYNKVAGYPAGIHEGHGHRIIVHSQDKRYFQDSPQKLQELMHDLYGKVNLEKVDEVIVYAGLNALSGALAAAIAMANNESKKVKLVACDCRSSMILSAEDVAAAPPHARA